MAQDVVFLRHVQVLAIHRNHNEKTGKTYRTAYCFKPGPEEGFDGPQMLEISVEEDVSLNYLKSKVGKGSADLVCEKKTFKDNARYSYLGTLDEFLKGAA